MPEELSATLTMSHACDRMIPSSHRVFGEGPTGFMRAKTSVMYDMTPLRTPHDTGWYKSKNWLVDQCFFTQSENDAMAVHRTKAQAETGSGLVFLHRYMRGGIRGIAGDIVIDRDPGQMYLFDQALLVNCIQLPVKAEGIYLPKALIGYDPARHPGFIRFGDYGAIGAAMFQAFDRLIGSLDKKNAINQKTFENLIAAVRVALSSENTSGDCRRRARNAVAELIRQKIERSLDDPQLSVGALLKTFGVSRASLFRMFEYEGGVRHYIQQRRLHRAVLEIARQGGVRGSVTAASEKWGFSSAANFNRSVRNYYGVAPGSLVGALPDADEYRSVGDDIQSFVQQTELIAA